MARIDYSDPAQGKPAHPRDPRQEPQRQHLPHDGALAELLRTILPARRRDPPQGRARSDRARACDHAHRHFCEAPYEIVAHKRIGKNVGVTDEQNAALDNWQSATCFDEVQRAALAFTDEIVKLKKPTDATFKAIAAKLTPAALIELQLSVGFYIMTSKFLETFEIDMQPVTEVVSLSRGEAGAHAISDVRRGLSWRIHVFLEG